MATRLLLPLLNIWLLGVTDKIFKIYVYLFKSWSFQCSFFNIYFFYLNVSKMNGQNIKNFEL